MADYIKSNILCQAYLRIERPQVHADELPALRDELIQFIARRSRFILYPEVDANVRFRSGSLVAYLTVAGSLYVALQGYPKFREGVLLLFGDVKRLADSMILETQFTSKARSPDVSRHEARTGVIGSLKELIDAIDNVNLSAGLVKVDTLSIRLGRILFDATRLLDVLRDRRDVILVAENLKSIVFDLPTGPKDPKGKNPSRKSLDVYRAAVRTFQTTMDDYIKRAKGTAHSDIEAEFLLRDQTE